MSVPDVLEANDPPQGSNEPHGIIYTIRTAVSSSNILNYVVPTAHTLDYGDVNSYVKWDSYCATTSTQGSYIEIEFKDRFVFPTFYSFKGITNSLCIAKEWNLYGLVESTDTPELIATNTTEGSTYCSPLNDGYCGNNNWGTFAIHGAKKAYRYFRIESKVPVCSGNYRVVNAAFEVFGVLSKDGRTGVKLPRKTICHASCQVSRHIPLYLALRLCLGFFITK